MTFITDKSDTEMQGCELTIGQVKDLVRKLDIKDLETRPVYIEPETGKRLPNNAIVVATNYPFGFSGRCVGVLFSEWRNKHGYRTVTATSDKFHVGWNAFKNGTYTMGVSYFYWNADNHPQIATKNLNFHDAAYHMRQDIEKGKTYRKDLENFRDEFAGLYSEDDKFSIEFYLKLMQKEADKLAVSQ